MAWTYDVTQLQNGATGVYPGSTIGVRYQIRLLLQDNQTARQLLQDEEIDWFQTQEMNAYMAAAACCTVIIGRVGIVKSKRVGDLSISYDPQFYHMLRMKLEARGMTYQQPYAGGISVSDKNSERANLDHVIPHFFMDMGVNPGASQPAPGNVGSAATTNPNAL